MKERCVEMTEQLLQSYQRYYNITKMAEEDAPLIARCEYYEHNEQYMVTRKANLWTADGEEFLYLFSVPHLTEECYLECQKQAYEDGIGRLNVGPGHMCSYITAVIVCETCDPAALQKLKKSKIHKNFLFSLHGWMDYRAAVVCSDTGKTESNGAGRIVAKNLRKVLFYK